MRRKGLHDGGSALIAVIISMLLIGIIAAIVLELAMGSIERARIGAGSSDNFYSAEEVVDEIKNQLDLIAEEASAEAYEKYLQTYAIKSKDRAVDMDALFGELFKETFLKKLKASGYKMAYYYIDSYTGLETLDWQNTNRLDGLLYKTTSSTSDYVIRDADKIQINGDGTPLKIITDGNNVIIKNLSASYRDDSGNVSTITTDLVFGVKSLKINLGANVGVSTSVADFVLIADQSIRNDTSGGASPIVMGNVYGGGMKEDDAHNKVNGDGGLVFDGGTVNLFSDLVITRGTIETKNGASLIISHSNENRQVGVLRDYYGEVWARNFLMSGDDKSTIEVQGECYVADDLTVNAKESEFTLKGNKSAYYGFNYTAAPGTPDSSNADENSAIIVNAENVKLDLHNAKKLLLAGKSYVNVPQQWGNPVSGRQTYMQGESITYRSLQSAYLLPGECLVEYEHNPITEAEYLEGYTIDIEGSFEKDHIDLKEYLDMSSFPGSTSSCYTTATVKYGPDQLVYFYMNFASPDKAARYFQEYERVYGQAVSEKLGMAKNGKILVNRAGAIDDDETHQHVLDDQFVINTGNVLYYDGTDYILYAANRNSDEVFGTQSELLDKYNHYCTTLNPTSGYDDLAIELAKNIVVWEKVRDGDGDITEIKDTSGTVVDFTIGDVRGYGPSAGTRPAWLATSKGNVKVENDGVTVTKEDGTTLKKAAGAGIIIADGDVTINSADFWGTIIATGDIILKGDAKVFAASSDVKAVMETNRTVIPYFTRDDESAGEVKVAGSGMVEVKYKNWTKE